MDELKKRLNLNIHNRFDIEVIDKETGEVKQRARAFNVVCNGYYNTVINIMTNHTHFDPYIAYGKGSGAPAVSDTALFSHIGYASDSSSYGAFDTMRSDTANGVWTHQIKRTIPYDISVGETITEVGFVAWKSGTGYVLCTHAMLQDMNGNPISITHTSTDIISIYCTMYLHYEGQDGDIHLYAAQHRYSDSAYLGLVEAALIYKTGYRYNYYWFASLFLPRGATAKSLQCYSSNWGALRVDSNFQWTADSSGRKITSNVVRASTDKGNSNGIQTIHFCVTTSSTSTQSIGGDGATSMMIECGQTTVAPANITSEAVGVGDGSTTKFKTKFFCPYNATVYVNGVAQSANDVSVIKSGNIAIANQADLFATMGSGSADGAYIYVNMVYADNVNLPKSMVSDTGIQSSAITEVLFPYVGLYSIYAPNGTVKGSNDGTTWVDVETAQNNNQMNQSGAHYRYYKTTDGNRRSAYMNAYDGYNIVFNTAPAQGDVITIDYTTDYIPKDSDHVLDVSVEVTFGEWTGE